jgi:hypothetical protein
MRRLQLSVRSRVFLGGMVGSGLLLGAFFVLAVSPIAWTRVGNTTGLLIVRLFEWLNPPLMLLFWLSTKMWGPEPPHGVRQIVLSIVYLALFIGWWWIVALLVERLASRAKRRAVGGA